MLLGRAIRKGILRRRPSQAGGLAISGSPSTDATIGVPYSFTAGVSGGVAPYTFAIAGALPPGLAFNTATGALTGTPT